MADRDVSLLQSKLQAFLDDPYPLVRTANELEEMLAEWGETEPFEETADMLAQYDPGGGPYMFDIEQMKRRITFLQRHLQRVDTT